MTTPTPSPTTDTISPADSQPDKAGSASGKGRAARPSWLSGSLLGYLALAIINAIGVWGIFLTILGGHWWVLTFIVAILVLVDGVYFLPGRRLLPWKYLTPALILIMIFQVFTVLYTAGIALTNYGDGHNSTKGDAIAAIINNHDVPVAGAQAVPSAIIQDAEGNLGLAVIEGNRVRAGVEKLGDAQAQVTGDVIESVEGYTVLSFQDMMSRQEEVLDIRISDGKKIWRTLTGDHAQPYESTITYDAASDTFTDTAGTVYSPTEEGTFAAADGTELSPGWRVGVGFKNFATVFTDDTFSGPFLKVTAWTFAFAFLSVALTFFAGLLMALLLNNPNMKFRTFYRAVLILPYAFPSFLSLLIWAGLLNADFGFFNQVLLGGATIPWLTNPWLAKISILLVNLWLGFPYMFLVTTGALQSIPADLYKAARIDGATPWVMFRKITLPLLLVAVGPLLVASFAMNFNNFNVIYLLTGGGPRDLSSTTGVGETDILISFVYKIAFASGENQYGLASAISLLIFVMVAIVSGITLLRSSAMKEINQ